MIKIQLLLTGNEIMAGHTVDSNSAMIGEQLATIGQELLRKVTIGDDINLLCTEINSLSHASDILIINGGLGPTIDDLTAQALSIVTEQPLVEHPAALRHINSWCQDRQLSVNEANRKQAILPAQVEIIDNPTGSAVGFSCEHNNCLIICTPGVPSELRNMMEQSIIAIIRARSPDHIAVDTLRLKAFGVGESTLQQLVNDQCKDWPSTVELGFRAGMPLLEIKLSIRDPRAKHEQQACLDALQQLIGEYIIGTNDCTLAHAVLDLLQSQQAKVSTAESCTGGLIASQLTEIAGASAMFEAGFITYSNTMKSKMLGVNEQLLIEHGAVSEPVVNAMLAGACQQSGADYGVAVSGIAGPDGGTTAKPLGTVWIAWGHKSAIKTQQLCIPGARKWFQTMVAAIALDLLRRELLSIHEPPRYLSRYQAHST